MNMNARGAMQQDLDESFQSTDKKPRRLPCRDEREAYSRTKKKCMEGEATERDSRGGGGGGGDGGVDDDDDDDEGGGGSGDVAGGSVAVWKEARMTMVTVVGG